jgi:hypothetical protein
MGGGLKSGLGIANKGYDSPQNRCTQAAPCPAACALETN